MNNITKICVRCKIEKDIKDFTNDKSKNDGKFHTCKKCMKSYYLKNSDKRKENQQKRRKKWTDLINEIKSKLKCEKCNESHISTIDFHHKDNKEKDFGISSIRYKQFNEENIKKLYKEINKCNVLCSNCHRKLHWDKSPYSSTE